MIRTTKRVVASLAVLGVVALAQPSMAAFTSVSKSTISAQAIISAAAGQVAMNAVPRVLITSAAATGLTFTVASLPASWVMANQYLQVTSTVTAAGGVQIYTQNLATDVWPNSYTGGNNPAGLVDNTIRTQTLPMVWSIQDSVTQMRPSASSIATLTPPDFIASSWFYFSDPGDVDVDGAGTDTGFIGNGADYVSLVVEGNGGSAGAVGGLFHYNNGPGFVGDPFNGFGDRTSVVDAVYVAANFTSAVAGRTYTGTVRVEAFTE